MVKKVQHNTGDDVFFTSDLHFDHKNIMKYCPWSRGHLKDKHEMNQAIIDNWNSVVGVNDYVYCLGDLGFCNASKLKEHLGQLNGSIHVILGNHDNQINESFINEGYIDSYQDALELVINSQRIILYHYGQRVWNHQGRHAWHFYGHSHGSLPGIGKSMDVGLDSRDLDSGFKPFSFEQVKALMDARQTYVADHHSVKK